MSFAAYLYGERTHPWLSPSERTRLTEFFAQGAARCRTAPEHWIDTDLSVELDDAADTCLSYCEPCGADEVARLRRMHPDSETNLKDYSKEESDGIPECHICGCMLQSQPTEYACEEEVNCFLTWRPFDPTSPDDCFCMHQVIQKMGWSPQPRLSKARGPKEALGIVTYFEQLHQLGRIILWWLDRLDVVEDLAHDLMMSHTPG